MSATIIEFPLKVVRELCSNCEHSALGTYGVYCTLFNEQINNEAVAEDCGEFDPVPVALAVTS